MPEVQGMNSLKFQELFLWWCAEIKCIHPILDVDPEDMDSVIEEFVTYLKLKGLAK